jgi:formylglycine-generating enzyme required for sulfatase activity
MLDPLVAVLALAIVILKVPLAPVSDPGPSPECPSDMRLVAGKHHDVMQHLCVDPRRDTKDTHCFAYWEGISGEEGPATDVRVCMDRFEAPNAAGAKPLVMKSYVSAKKWCEQRRKRPCTEQEWELACEGPEHRPLAYGWRVDVAVCNSAKQWRPFDAHKLYGEEGDKEVERLWQGTPSGNFARCVSPFGIVDMMGNVEEWVTSRKSRKYPGALMGGFWAKPWTGCRGTNDAHEPTFTFYETGFRCCSEPRTSEAGKR